jgi:hypothetical protein
VELVLRIDFEFGVKLGRTKQRNLVANGLLGSKEDLNGAVAKLQ